MGSLFKSFVDTFISPINAVNDLIKSSDAKIISEEGFEVLSDEKKMQKVAKAIEDFNDPEKYHDGPSKIIVPV